MRLSGILTPFYNAYNKMATRGTSTLTTKHSLRDDKAFPSFMNCPHENFINELYYRPDQDGVFSAARHWCFLGEITDKMVFNRLCLTVKDKDNLQVPANFHLDSPGMRTFAPGMSNFPVHRNVPQALVDNGNTIAILYAQQHPFMDGSFGFRIEDADVVQVWIFLKEKIEREKI
jgi:hypothetical protein